MNFGRSQTNNNGGVDLLNLQKGDLLDLTKSAPFLNRAIIACGWKINKKIGEDNYDLDLSAFMLNDKGRVSQAKLGTRVVYFGQKMQEGIYLEEDNLTGNDDDDDGDAERIHIDLKAIPQDVQAILFCVNIFEAPKRRQTFGAVRDAYIRLLDEDDNERELLRFKLTEQASNSTAVVFAKLFRQNGGWTFDAIGENHMVSDLNGLLIKYIG